ncbi:serine/threonine-protein kinase [Paraburkholderia sp. 22B1P]|uniref:serine/threonine protein kinase n=1 Tax=Paraburkholderia sp. 22B1P TaxID=3080498 RepID=UPI00308A5444|nr:serine/threonine-protein kinase [Paraburkholderia sp. 22B1P]
MNGFASQSELSCEGAREQVPATLAPEHTGYQSLDKLVEPNAGRPFNLTRFLRIAIGLAEALIGVHKQGLIHKDIRPANVLVNDAGSVRLIGFSIASHMPRDGRSLLPPDVVAGSLAYMSPEQTGRMNRPIDSRSDLYSLGVTLYVLSTGRLPFTGADPMEWIHCHLARQPLSPEQRTPDIPAVVSSIIMKLLANPSEARYQTAVGQLRDLVRCVNEWEFHRRVTSFALGKQDKPDRLLIPERLHGRATELDALLSSFDRVVAGPNPEFVLVSGDAGVGKSFLCRCVP